LKGDALSAQGKKAEARAAYKSALDKMADKPGAGRELLQQKLDSLGEAA
jgi:predicted negative regulator of RcsB-dependent stress response